MHLTSVVLSDQTNCFSCNQDMQIGKFALVASDPVRVEDSDVIVGVHYKCMQDLLKATKSNPSLAGQNITQIDGKTVQNYLNEQKEKKENLLKICKAEKLEEALVIIQDPLFPNELIEESANELIQYAAKEGKSWIIREICDRSIKLDIKKIEEAVILASYHGYVHCVEELILYAQGNMSPEARGKALLAITEVKELKKVNHYLQEVFSFDICYQDASIPRNRIVNMLLTDGPIPQLDLDKAYLQNALLPADSRGRDTFKELETRRITEQCFQLAKQITIHRHPKDIAKAKSIIEGDYQNYIAELKISIASPDALTVSKKATSPINYNVIERTSWSSRNSEIEKATPFTKPALPTTQPKSIILTMDPKIVAEDIELNPGTLQSIVNIAKTFIPSVAFIATIGAGSCYFALGATSTVTLTLATIAAVTLIASAILFLATETTARDWEEITTLAQSAFPMISFNAAGFTIISSLYFGITSPITIGLAAFTGLSLITYTAIVALNSLATSPYETFAALPVN